MNKKNYYNSSLLLLHEKHLENYSLYELFTLRYKYLNNNNFIVEKVNDKIIIIIENVILSKPNGNKLLKILNDNDKLYNIIKSENIKIDDNIKLLHLYENINIMEDIMNLKKHSLFNKQQFISKIYLTCKVFVNNMTEKILLCKF